MLETRTFLSHIDSHTLKTLDWSLQGKGSLPPLLYIYSYGISNKDKLLLAGVNWLDLSNFVQLGSLPPTSPIFEAMP